MMPTDEPIVKCPKCEIDVASERLKRTWGRMIDRITELGAALEKYGKSDGLVGSNTDTASSTLIKFESE